MSEVIVLLSTYNGEKFIREQIDSILSQEQVSLKIIVRDDGSTDNTTKILDEYQNNGKLLWYDGVNLGPGRSFWNLLQQAPSADYYAFSDQDDVWLPDKLFTAINKLSNYSHSLYFSAKRLVSDKLDFIADTYLNSKLTLEESFVNNPATGCTFVFNKQLRNLLLTGNPQILSLHDSLIYRICLATNGIIYYDKQPHILYRQHANNVVGYIDIRKRINFFFKSLVEKNNNIRSNVASEILKCYDPYITSDNKRVLILLSEYRHSFFLKCKLLMNGKMKANSLGGRLAFIINVLLNKY